MSFSRTGEDIATEILMVRMNTVGPFLIVEGPSDERFFSSRVISDCYIAIGGGKNTVEVAVSELDRNAAANDIKYVGVVDEDYDWLIGHVPPSRNVVKTDPRDIEGIFFRSKAVISVLAEYADRNEWAAYEKKCGRSVLDTVLQFAEPFGRIRMVNMAGPKVDLSKYKPVRFFRPGWTYDMSAAMSEAVRLGVSSSIEDLKKLMAELEMPSIWHCVRGHDLIDIFVGGLIDQLGGKRADKSGVESILRQALSDAEFKTTALYSGLITWCAGVTELLI